MASGPPCQGNATSTPRYSREDMAWFVGILTAYGDQDYASQPEVYLDDVSHPDEAWVAVPAKYLKGAAAALSEAANRAPPHAELLAEIEMANAKEPR